MLKRVTFIGMLFVGFLVLVSSAGPDGSENLSPGQKGESQVKKDENGYPSYLSFVDGLHVTGTPIAVDIVNYRLEVKGAVSETLSVSYEELLKMESQRTYIELRCPGFFVDKGYWTGVDLRDILNLAGIDNDAQSIKFISIDGSYSSRLSMTRIKKGGVLLAYQFNDKPFASYHGFPLRLAAKDEPGNKWVKWLGLIEVEK
jgi:DMSO/TMAO reductase YedYZ molybdopterin-dependent catalytic subunit